MENLVRWLTVQWDRALAILAVVIGLVVILLGWRGVSGAELPAQQLPYLASGAVLGIFALGLGCTLWISAYLRDEWAKVDEVHQVLIRLEEQAVADEPVEAESVEQNGAATRRRTLRATSRSR